MENEKKTKIVIISLSVTAVLLVLCVILLIVGSNSKKNSKKILKDENYKESTNSVDNSLNNTDNNSAKVEDKKASEDKDTSATQSTPAKKVEPAKQSTPKIDSSKFIRHTDLNLIEKGCIDNDTQLTAGIEDDGYLYVADSHVAEKLSNVPVKYIYSISLLACHNVTLYFITKNNELYYSEDVSSWIDHEKPTAKKLTNSKIKEFLGIEKRNDGDYLKLLRENDTIEYIKYFDAY